VTVSLEEVEGVLEGRRAALDAVIHPRGPILVFVERDRGGLTADNGHALDDSDYVFVRVFGEGVCA